MPRLDGGGAGLEGVEQVAGLMDAVLFQKLAQDVGQDAAAEVVVYFNRGVDAKRQRDFLGAAIGAVDDQFYVHLGTDAIGEAAQVERLGAVEAKRLGVDSVFELTGQDAHADQIGAVDALK